MYKLAAREMFYRRYLEGNADDPFYPLMEDRVPALAYLGSGYVKSESWCCELRLLP